MLHLSQSYEATIKRQVAYFETSRHSNLLRSSSSPKQTPPLESSFYGIRSFAIVIDHHW